MRAPYLALSVLCGCALDAHWIYRLVTGGSLGNIRQLMHPLYSRNREEG